MAQQTGSSAVVGVCASVLLRHKNQRMNLLQHILSLILHRGHAGKQVNIITLKIQTTTNSSVSQAKLSIYMIVICAYMHAPRTISCAHVGLSSPATFVLVSLMNEPMVIWMSLERDMTRKFVNGETNLQVQ